MTTTALVPDKGVLNLTTLSSANDAKQNITAWLEEIETQVATLETRAHGAAKSKRIVTMLNQELALIFDGIRAEIAHPLEPFAVFTLNGVPMRELDQEAVHLIEVNLSSVQREIKTLLTRSSFENETAFLTTLSTSLRQLAAQLQAHV